MDNVFFKILFSNWKIKLSSFVVAASVWGVILGQRTLIITREVPIDYLLNPEAMVQDAVNTVRVSIEGKRSALHNFKVESAAPIIDLRNDLPGPKRLLIRKDSISLPIGAKVVSIDPKYVTLYLKIKSASLLEESLKKNKSGGGLNE